MALNGLTKLVKTVVNVNPVPVLWKMRRMMSDLFFFARLALGVIWSIEGFADCIEAVERVEHVRSEC